MNCSQLEQLFLEDLDNIRQDGVREHLEQCAECRKLQADLETIADLNQTLARKAVAPGDFPGLLNGRMTGPGPSVFWTLGAVAMLLTAAALAAGFWPLFDAVPEPASLAQELQPQQHGGAGIEFALSGDRRVDRTGNPAGEFFEVILRDASGAPSPYIVRVPSETRVQRTLAEASHLVHVSH